MSKLSPHRKKASVLNKFRLVHRTTGAFLFLFFVFVSTTGLLLGWKKHSNGIILPKSYTGTSTNLEDWLSLDSLQTIAFNALHDSVSPNLSLDVERIDVRKHKGMVKFVFIEGYNGIQLDGATGEILHIEKRRSDFIENIHDGSIIDHLLGTKKEWFKLVYTSIMGLALLTFSITGFWLWYGPKILRYKKRSKK